MDDQHPSEDAHVSRRDLKQVLHGDERRPVREQEGEDPEARIIRDIHGGLGAHPVRDMLQGRILQWSGH